MGQHLEFTFLSSENVEQSKVTITLVEAGLTVESKSSILDWLSWNFKRRKIRVTSCSYHGAMDMYWIRTGFDSTVVRDMTTLDDLKALFDEFLDLGRHLWAAFPFFEGTLSPEETGPMIYGIREAPAQDIRNALPFDNYARFFSQDAASLAQIHQWVPQAHPRAAIQLLPRNGSLVIWNPAREGVARFFSQTFDVELSLQ